MQNKNVKLGDVVFYGDTNCGELYRINRILKNDKIVCANFQLRADRIIELSDDKLHCTAPCPFDETNQTTDWIGNLFDNQLAVSSGNMIVGFINCIPVFAKTDRNILFMMAWQSNIFPGKYTKNRLLDMQFGKEENIRYSLHRTDNSECYEFYSVDFKNEW